MSTQNQINTKNITNVENQTKQSVKNINIDLSKIDMSLAIESFKRLEDVAAAANFDVFLEKMVKLKESFTDFQSVVRAAGTQTENFIGLPKNLQGLQIAQEVEVNNSVDKSVSVDLSNLSGAFDSLSGSIEACGQVFANIAGAFDSFGNMFLSIGESINVACSGVSEIINSVANLGNGLLTMSQACKILIPVLPQLGSAMLEMAVNMSGILAYLPQLAVFLGVLSVLSLLGEGLLAAGTGLMNIGLGLTSMTVGMTALLAFMPIFIESLAGITANVGGIILFVLLAAAMLVMAIALQMMNEQMTQFTDSMEKLQGLMSVGFVAAFAVFGAMLIAMSQFMGKVASGMDKITQAMGKQITKLAVLNPLLAAQAILTNPIMGGITVAAALAGGLLVKALLPAMATGGIVSSPTVAMVGEGRYPEAVVPLGDSPQFSTMKADIANAVLQGISATNMTSSGGKGKNLTVQLNIDGRQFAETTVRDFVETLNNEGYGVVRADAVYR